MSWQDDFVQVVNGTIDAIEWDGYTYQPGQKRMVPFLSMVNSYGDPRSKIGMPVLFRSPDGSTGVVQSREIQRMKVATAWNAGSGAGYSIAWDEIPRLQFFDVDGNRIHTVYDDPNGEKIMPADLSVEHQRDLEQELQRLRKQVNELARLAGVDDNIPTDESASIPSDIPSDNSASNTTQSPFFHAEDEVADNG